LTIHLRWRGHRAIDVHRRARGLVDARRRTRLIDPRLRCGGWIDPRRRACGPGLRSCGVDARGRASRVDRGARGLVDWSSGRRRAARRWLHARRWSREFRRRRRCGRPRRRCRGYRSGRARRRTCRRSRGGRAGRRARGYRWTRWRARRRLLRRRRGHRCGRTRRRARSESGSWNGRRDGRRLFVVQPASDDPATDGVPGGAACKQQHAGGERV
jgi:hypothetical protein